MYVIKGHQLCCYEKYYIEKVNGSFNSNIYYNKTNPRAMIAMRNIRESSIDDFYISVYSNIVDYAPYFPEDSTEVFIVNVGTGSIPFSPTVTLTDFCDVINESSNTIFSPSFVSLFFQQFYKNKILKPWISNMKLVDFNGYSSGYVRTLRNFGNYSFYNGSSIQYRTSLPPAETINDLEIVTVVECLGTNLNMILNGAEFTIVGNESLPATGEIITNTYVYSGTIDMTFPEVIRNGSWQLVSTDKFKVEIEPPQIPYSMPLEESAGSKYRKVSLSGRPISDDKPQTEVEDDSENFETYIDAMSLSLRRDEVDIFMSVPSSDLSLCVRRSYSPLVWNLKHGLRPHESPENVFGGNWKSNLTPFICIQEQLLDDLSSRTSPDSATTFDENGFAFSFAYYNNEFFNIPSGRSEQQAYLNSLKRVGSNIVLEKHFGTKINYEPSNIVLQTSSNRIFGSKDKTKYTYYRARFVEYRFGNKIVYQYPNTKTLIPEKIYVDGRDDIFIEIEQQNGLITKVRDSEGVEVSYIYDILQISASEISEQNLIANGISIDALNCTILSGVEKNGIRQINYNYNTIDYALDSYCLMAGESPYYNFYIELKNLVTRWEIPVNSSMEHLWDFILTINWRVIMNQMLVLDQYLKLYFQIIPVQLLLLIAK